MTSEEKTDNKDGGQPYELGFLFSPLVGADQLDEAVAKLIKGTLVNIGAEVQNELAPKMLKLAYPIKRTLDNKGTTFREAYFGTIYFTAQPEKVVTLESAWSRAPELVRYLLIRRSPAEINWEANQAARSVAVKLDQADLDKEQAIDKEIEDILAEAE